MDALDYLVERYRLDLDQASPIEIPNVGREALGEWFHDLGYTVGAEIGVERGLFSETLLKANPGLTLHCVDAWTTYDGYKKMENARDLPGKYLETLERLKGYQVVYHKKFSMHALRDFADGSLDFVYIDANHALPWVMDDLVWWSKKVRPGGMVAGHDYIRGKPKNPSVLQVVEAVTWYTELKPVRPWFLLGTKAKVPGEVRDRNRSYAWVQR